MSRNQNPQVMELATPWLTVVEAAQYLSVQPKTIYNWINKGRIKVHKFHAAKNGGLRFLRKDLDDVLTKGKR